MLRFPEDADYSLHRRKEDDPDVPPADLTIRLTEGEWARCRRLLARLRRGGKQADRDRVRNGLIRILGRETMELIEAQGHRHEGGAMEIRLVRRKLKGNGRGGAAAAASD